MATAHVVPIDDTFAHGRDDDCPCGPWVEPVEDGTGRIAGFVVVHASLDGREQGKASGQWGVFAERVGENV